MEMMMNMCMEDMMTKMNCMKMGMEKMSEMGMMDMNMDMMMKKMQDCDEMMTMCMTMMREGMQMTK